MAVTIRKKTNGMLPRVPFVRLSEAILGPEYDLSVAVVSSKESHRLNKTYRGKDYPTDVLSFPLSKNSGELVLDVVSAKKKAPDFEMSASNYLLFVVIHGMLHLKGFDHGSKMEQQEKKFLKRFS